MVFHGGHEQMGQFQILGSLEPTAFDLAPNVREAQAVQGANIHHFIQQDFIQDHRRGNFGRVESHLEPSAGLRKAFIHQGTHEQGTLGTDTRRMAFESFQAPVDPIHQP